MLGEKWCRKEARGSMLSISDIREFALSMPGVEEVEHWGKTSFRMNNKIFAVIQDDKKTLTVKTTKEIRALLIQMAPDIYRIPDSFSNLNYMHINLELANDAEVTEYIQNAWGHIAPKKAAKAFFENRAGRSR
ncbi:MmcQ/YjbR family DNA-binding protein [Cohnella hashimotonis]|uniref:MmcQ/YjbR family DNA-binding protein n=1 Tax=Cohnella hashimotonis TaxID=2826895 RepID=A0ABT6TKX2_9BACL|nr:MmcQ/YjbR family DNA-binding protein [Cohnella hashimotonis]MDI4647486.1 MmcQ/YjbR family DNA-binding protein [Cohnella hashimotonis]